MLEGRSGELRPVARSTGTTVEVKELFFSTPARRKFLKTDATELAHCIEAVRRHALARPDVGFAIRHEGKLIEQWRACEGPDALEKRLCDVLGTEFAEKSIAVDTHLASGTELDDSLTDRLATPFGSAFSSPRIRVWGRVGIPDAARARADQQFCYVNGRFVRDKVLTHAARSAYEDVLHGQRQPVYALYVETDPARVDVNVHPTKIEVRFRDSREVHQAVRHAVENALAVPRSAVEDKQAQADLEPFTKKTAFSQTGWLQPAMNFEATRGNQVSDLQALWQPATKLEPAPENQGHGQGQGHFKADTQTPTALPASLSRR
jgi:DNA mismatch repair protein MutL